MACAGHQFGPVSAGRESAADDLGLALDAAAVTVDGDDRQDDTVLGKVAAVADHHLFHHVVHRSRIDADAAHGHLARLARAMRIDLQYFAGFHDEGLLQARVAQVLGQTAVLGKLPKLAMNGHEVARAHQIQHQLQLLNAGVPGDVQRRIHRCRT